MSVFFAALSLQIYTRLSHEEPIAKIYFKKQQEKVYKAYLTTAEQTVREYKILGDQWRIDAQFIKLKPWANIFGLDSVYSLERLEGRYKKVVEQNRLRKLAYDLGEEQSISLPAVLIDYNFLIDTHFGSSAYTAIDISKTYTVFRSQFGILIREHPNPDYINEQPDLFNKVINIFKS